MSVIQVKSYLFPENSKVCLASVKTVDEIRRFNLVLDNKAIYNNLIDKLKQAYGSLIQESQEIRTYWQDEENELVGFSSDAELQYAIDLQTALKMSSPYEKHGLFKVYVAIKLKSASEEPRIHFGVICDNCDGSIIGNRYKCSVCPDYDLCEECKQKNIHNEHSMNKITKPRQCPYQRGQKWQRGPNFGRRCNRSNPFESIIKDFANFPQQAASNMQFMNSPEQLKSFGENLKKFLDPFGIDVSYYVDNLNKEQTKEEARKPNESNNSTETKKTEQSPKPTENPTKSDSLMDDSIKDSLISEKEVLIPESEKITVTKSAENKAPESSKPSAPEKDELIDLEKSIHHPFEEAINALKNVVQTPAETEEDKQSSDQSIIDGFNLVDIEKELKIIKAIESLRSMGYTDDGGWLTRLVSAKNGNINEVLDAITPFVSKN